MEVRLKENVNVIPNYLRAMGLLLDLHLSELEILNEQSLWGYKFNINKFSVNIYPSHH